MSFRTTVEAVVGTVGSKSYTESQADYTCSIRLRFAPSHIPRPLIDDKRAVSIFTR
jgi:hypothetical protein